MPARFDLVWRDHLEQLRRWAILATLTAYEGVDVDDLDGSLQQVAATMQDAYGVAVINALDSTDEYMYLITAMVGGEYVADWRLGRPDAPTRLFGGTPFAQWMANAAPAIKRLIGMGMDPAQAVEVSRARTAQQMASSPLQLARSTTWNRFVVDSVIAHDDVAPSALKWTDEVESYANLWDGQRVRDYQGSLQRWQRVPSPGACGFCLMLATRTDYTSADAAMYAGGAEGTVRREYRRGRENMRAGVSRRRTSGMESGERYHRNCRCTVRMAAKSGATAVVTREDFERLTARDADGNLIPFYDREVVYKSGRSGRYRYTADDVNFAVAADNEGIPMPEVAPWKDAWREPPRRRKNRAAYDEWRGDATP